jgi:SAM-dependent methyltransferase
MVLAKMQTEHWQGKDLNTITSYWKSPIAIERSKWFVEQLKQFEFSSIFEVGFFAGRNLRYIKEAFPNKHLAGIEINKKAVKFAKEKLDITQLIHLDLHKLDEMSGVFDIVFSSGVLIHVSPADIPEVLNKFIRKASKYVMHIEHDGQGELVAGPKELKPIYKVSDQLQWRPNLVGAYKSLGYIPQVIPLPGYCKTNGASELIIVKL